MEESTPRRRLAPARILIIDDDPVFARVLAHFLELRHYKIDIAHDGLEGIKRFEQESPSLVFCDLNMPGLTGFQVIARIRKLNEQVPLIVISAADKIQDAVEAMKSGAWDYIEKPIENFDVLWSAVTNVLRRASLQKENSMLREQLEKLVRMQNQEIHSLQAELHAVSSAVNFGYCATDPHLQIQRHSSALAQVLAIGNAPIENRTLAEIFKCKINGTCLICDYEDCPFRLVIAENCPRETVWQLDGRSVPLKILPVVQNGQAEGVFVMAESPSQAPS